MRTSGCFLLALCVGNSIASISWKTPVYRSDSIPTNGGLGGPTGLRVDTFQPNRYTPGNVGVCFSGGGSIALAETMGRLRALKYLGLIDKVKSISSVSGGTWATAPFTFLPDTIDDDEFLGTMTTDPSKLSLTSLFNGDQSTVLSYVSSNNLGFVPTQPGMKIAALVLQIPELLALGIPENRMWTHLMGEYVLKPFGLSEFGSDHCPTHSFCADAAQCAEVRAANPNVPLRGMRAGRPFHIMNSAMFVRANEEPSSNTFDYLAPIHATPWRMGIASSPAATFNDNGEQVPVGGGTIGSHAFNSKISAIDSQGDISVDQPCPFGLSDITGMSSAAPAELAKNQYPVFAGVDPQYSYFPIQGASVGSGSVTKFSDGGTVDNTGILGTLQYEDIDTVMSFVYTQVSIHKTADGTIVIDGSYPSLFGYQQWTAQRGWELYPATDVPLEVNNLNTEFRFNQVFESSAFADLLQGLYDASTNNGQDPVGTASPVFLQKNLKVLPNSWWGIKGGRTVNVLWTYSDMVEDWRTQLPFTVQADLKLKPNFPHINFLETGIDAVTVNELAQLSSWVLYDRRAAYEALFDPVALANYDASTDSTRTRRHHGSSVSAAGVAIASVLVAAAFTVAIVAVVVARRRRAWRQKEQMSVPLLTVPSMA